MTTYNFGDIVVVNVLFSNQFAVKPRPAVIVSNLEVDSELGEFILSDPSVAGLKIPSRVKAFVSTVDPRLIKRSIGKLGNTDMQSLRTMLQKLFL